MLKVDNIDVYYGAIHAIKGISIEVQYYDKISESISSLWSTYSKMIQPGGYMDAGNTGLPGQ